MIDPRLSRVRPDVGKLRTHHRHCNSCYFFVTTQPRKIELRLTGPIRTMSAIDDLPRDVTNAIITFDSQTWRSMRLVSKYYHQLLSWPAYVDKFTVVTVTDLSREWSLDGKLHREHDLPAAIYSDGVRGWYQFGQLHRDHGKPARITRYGSCLWHSRGQLHRSDKPDVAYYPIGRKWRRHGYIVHDHVNYREWRAHGPRHRVHDLPAVISNSGGRNWYYRGVGHKEHDTPAVVCDNVPSYVTRPPLSRRDKPASAEHKSSRNRCDYDNRPVHRYK
jgi:hypothetical protein